MILLHYEILNLDIAETCALAAKYTRDGDEYL